MTEVSWHVGIHITRSAGGDVHWYVDGSDGLDVGYLIDEAHTTTLTGAVLAARRTCFMELMKAATAQALADGRPGEPPR